MRGKVYLIGAGPGDSGLLTLKGRDCLVRADVVVYDTLVHPQILEFAKPSASRIPVGKRGKHHALEQSRIHDLLVKQAQRGRVVARLKSGDPFLFGRGSEEAEYLAGHHIPYEVVPGVSSASAAAAYAGIPLTDRRMGSMVTLVDGREEEKRKITSVVEWSRISRQGTLIIFMGLDQFETITQRLIRLNWDETLPAAVIRWGSLPGQVVVEGTLGDIAQKARSIDVHPPALIVIGRVVGLRKKLRWFESKPLFGKRLVITRAAEQAPELAHLLQEAGAEVLSFPTIQILPPKNWSIPDQAIREIATFDWILFTSANGVGAFVNRLKTLGGDVRDLKGIRLGAIGPKTSASLQAFGLKVDAFPSEYRAETLADVIGEAKNVRVLLVRAEKAREILPKTLEARGALVTIAPVYRTIKPRGLAADIRQPLLDRKIDAITFTSPSTVDGLMQYFSARERRRIFEHVKAAVIGPITAATLREYGVHPTIRAKTYTVDALAKAIIQYFSK
ncbi:MAG: uroporphyrinogen-III C-methyltransferase [Elusimicrobiota bacterium]|jgi:uroporphyrinogen III methyltransferase/synthase